MKIRLSISWLALSLLLLLAGCATVSTPATEAGAGEPAIAETAKLNVVSTVAPITNIVYNIAGDRINLTGIVPEGVNSHTFEPAPSDARTLAEADVVFLNGLTLEEPTLKLAEANKRDDAEIVLLGEQTVTPDDYVYDFSFPEAAGNPNPHLWTNPIYVKRYAEIVTETLAARDPQNADFYRANLDAYEQQLDALDVAIQETIDSIPAENRKLLTYHDSWAYFAPRYGVEVIGAIQPADFSEPSAQEVADLITQLREAAVPAIFGSEVFPSPVLDQIGREAGVEYVDTLRDDDLPGAPGEENHSYIGMMVENLATMARTLGGDPSIISEVNTANVPGQDATVEQPQ